MWIFAKKCKTPKSDENGLFGSFLYFRVDIPIIASTKTPILKLQPPHIFQGGYNVNLGTIRGAIISIWAFFEGDYNISMDILVVFSYFSTLGTIQPSDSINGCTNTVTITPTPTPMTLIPPALPFMNPTTPYSE